tara:strand:+ start:432 stop:575 length:144 start_codon:yes stop_codon:yes gene_type:complete
VTKRGKLREGREQMTLLAKRARHAPSPPPQQQQQPQLLPHAATAADR